MIQYQVGWQPDHFLVLYTVILGLVGKTLYYIHRIEFVILVLWRCGGYLVGGEGGVVGI